MWFTVELFGVTVLRIGVGGPAEKPFITHTDGSFELAPPVADDTEYQYEEERFGFR